MSIQVLHPLQQRFLNLINQENFAQISQEEAVKQEIIATLEALCGIAEATQIDNVASLFSFLMDFLSSCIGLMEVRLLGIEICHQKCTGADSDVHLTVDCCLLLLRCTATHQRRSTSSSRFLWKWRTNRSVTWERWVDHCFY